MFELLIKNDDSNKSLIIVSGEIDIYSAPDFKEKLYSVVGKGQRDIIIELSGLTYIDSMGLGILVGALKRVKENEHNIVIRNPRNTVRKLFGITGLDRVFVMEERES